MNCMLICVCSWIHIFDAGVHNMRSSNLNWIGQIVLPSSVLVCLNFSGVEGITRTSHFSSESSPFDFNFFLGISSFAMTSLFRFFRCFRDRSHCALLFPRILRKTLLWVSPLWNRHATVSLELENERSLRHIFRLIICKELTTISLVTTNRWIRTRLWSVWELYCTSEIANASSNYL